MRSSSLEYDVVDVFAEHPYAGNPLAVVHGTSGLPTAHLQAIAREFNLSETTFPTPVDPTTYHVRIFTPEAELPFAGHPTVGTAWVLRRRGELRDGDAVQRCGAGNVGVGVGPGGARLSAAAREVGDPVPLPELLSAAGVPADRLLAPLRAASCGLGFVYARAERDVVEASHPLRAWPATATGTSDPLGGLCVYAVEPGADGVLEVLARVYCPEVGVPEDPATGSAAAGLGLVLVADGTAAPAGTTRYTVRQGLQVGRPSLLECTVDAADGAARTAHVGGEVHAVARGTLRSPGDTP